MTNARVLVTGGGRGIGRAIALRFAREGGKVVVAARTSSEIDAVVAEIERAGGSGLAAQMDVTDHGSVEAAVWRALQFLGDAIDVLVNDAGVFDVAPIEALTVAKWRWMFEVNVDGPFYVTKECLDALRASERAHVFNVASAAAKRGYAGETAYCASKYALRGFGDALREDLRPDGIRVSTVYPGATDTTIFDRVPGSWDRSRMNTPEDVAEVVWKAWTAPAGADVDDLDVPPRV
jgi:NADP-dependent 3-hydroxy acid dehydrogenase YdfG